MSTSTSSISGLYDLRFVWRNNGLDIELCLSGNRSVFQVSMLFK